MASTRFTVEGLRELEKALEDLRPATAKNVARRALVKATQPVADHMSELAPPGKYNNLKRSIGISTRLSDRQKALHRKMFRSDRTSVELFLGPDYRRSGNHAHLVEFGTAERRHKSGKSVGRMPPHPFARPAWDAGKQGILTRLADLMWVEIEKAAARAARKAARLAKKS
ncbi:HK97-gp10 family putative phage morphogenesis protein [Pikeienuella sp. HZG-20]|uniref:HK97-gp10 family putative phage morphogenesis protein n=1 Tax=Paludibacillus litoralis TaxID=3133267 RepID=UPI0030EE8E98